MKLYGFLGALTCLICTHLPLNSNLRDDGYRSVNLCASMSVFGIAIAVVVVI